MCSWGHEFLLYLQERVRLAERIDELERTARKDEADMNYLVKQSNEIGVH